MATEIVGDRIAERRRQQAIADNEPEVELFYGLVEYFVEMHDKYPVDMLKQVSRMIPQEMRVESVLIDQTREQYETDEELVEDLKTLGLPQLFLPAPKPARHDNVLSFDQRRRRAEERERDEG